MCVVFSISQHEKITTPSPYAEIPFGSGKVEPCGGSARGLGGAGRHDHVLKMAWAIIPKWLIRSNNG